MKIFIILFLYSISFSLFSKDGVLIYSKGKVFINKELSKKLDVISYGETVKVADNSLAVISMNNGSKVKINEKSSLEFKRPKVLKSKRTNIIQLIKGSVFVKFNKNKSKGERLKLQAKMVSMGVRGTEFFASFGKASNEDVWMCVNEGLVEVNNQNDKKPVFVKAGEGVVSKAHEKTSSPQELPWTKKLNWNMDPNLGKIKNEISIEAAYSDPLHIDYD